MPDAMKYQCPSCQRLLYNRRLANCGYCGAAIPAELRFTPEEVAALDRQMKEWEEKCRQREKEKEAQRAAESGATGGVDIPMGF